MKKDKKYTLVKTGKIVIVIACSTLIGFTGFVGKLAYDAKKASNSTSYSDSDAMNNSTYVDSNKGYLNVQFSKEKDTFKEDKKSTTIKMNKSDYNDFINLLDSYNYEFSMEQYYDLNSNINLYNNLKNKKSENFDIITNGKLDSDKLYNIVLKNNNWYMSQDSTHINFAFSETSNSDIKKICNLIVDTYNDNSEHYGDIRKISDTLRHLKIFENKTSTANAYVTDKDLILCFNPEMISTFSEMQSMIENANDGVAIDETVYGHEIQHIFQKISNDFDDENGIETGFCRKYDEAKVNSLWYSWLLDGCAEVRMTEILNTTPKIYQKKISYMQTYNLSRIFEDNYKATDLVDSSFCEDLDSVFNLLNIRDENSKLEFLSLMYSIEITQNNVEDFWEFYEASENVKLTDTEKNSIRMNIRTEAIKKLSKDFYAGLVKGILENKVTDLETIFYFMRLWELDCCGHLDYASNLGYEHAKSFIIWMDDVEKSIIKAISESNNISYDVLLQQYNNYHMSVETNGTKIVNANLSKFSDEKKKYINSAYDTYSVTYFARINTMIDYINNNSKEKEVSY